MTAFSNYAGQLVASGTYKNGPVVALESTVDRQTLNNLELINGLIPKISKTLIKETVIRSNDLERIFTKGSLPFGVGFEIAAFVAGAPNKKATGTCVPRGRVNMQSELALINMAWKISLFLEDRAVNKAVLTPEEVGAWIGQYFRTIDKTRADIRYYAMRQIVSDVIDGTRAVSSFTNSDSSGVSVDYNPTITGYVSSGGLIDSSVVIPELAMGSRPTISVEDTIAIADDLLNAVTEMHDQSTRYSKLGIDTSVPDTVQPYLVMESKVLNAMDSAVMSGAAQRLPTRTARDYIRTFADLVEIPSFAELPTNDAYADKRLGAVIL